MSSCSQLNYQVLSFLGTLPNINENMMLPKSDVFILLRNDGPSVDKKDECWSMIVHEDGSKRVRIEDDATSGDFRTLKPPKGCKGCLDKFQKFLHQIFHPRLIFGAASPYLWARPM